MTTERPALIKLRKLEAVAADPAATNGEKAAAEAAANRIRAKWRLHRAESARKAIEASPLMYMLGRAVGRVRSGRTAPAEASIMHSLGRAVRKTLRKP